MITINIPNGLNEFKQLSEVAQVLKKAWELKLKDSLASPYEISFSDKGKAIILIGEAKRLKKCLLTTWISYNCNITETEIENCKIKGVTCPFQTPEILLEKFKNMNYDINYFVKVTPAKFYPYKWALNEIENNLYSLSILNDKVKILSFEYFATDLKFHLNNVTLNSELYNENVKEYIQLWLDKEKNKIECEKEIQKSLNAEIQLKKINNKTDQPATSFDGKLTEPQLKKLLSELKSDENKFIHSETSFEQFTAIFEAKTIERPVKWIKNKPQLFYLLNCLIQREKVTMPESIYKTIQICFVDKDGNQLKNLKQSYNTFKNITESIRYSEKINNILSQVYTI